VTPAYVVLAAVAGLYFGVLYLLSENLLVVAIPHGLYDFVALAYLVRGPTRNTPKNDLLT
jgi:membrane protease YdiL (CAAX protease family)